MEFWSCLDPYTVWSATDMWPVLGSNVTSPHLQAARPCDQPLIVNSVCHTIHSPQAVCSHVTTRLQVYSPMWSPLIVVAATGLLHHVVHVLQATTATSHTQALAPVLMWQPGRRFARPCDSSLIVAAPCLGNQRGIPTAVCWTIGQLLWWLLWSPDRLSPPSPSPPHIYFSWTPQAKLQNCTCTFVQACCAQQLCASVDYSICDQ